MKQVRVMVGDDDLKVEIKRFMAHGFGTDSHLP